MMETVKEFFEVTTIHGLYHVSKTKSLRRFFWTVTSIAGFISAFSMIYESFQNFSKNPISTTIETFPISKVPFPPITVCPVKNTLTNLNYDLVNSQNLITWVKMKEIIWFNYFMNLSKKWILGLLLSIWKKL